jgi:hypothetical protein
MESSLSSFGDVRPGAGLHKPHFRLPTALGHLEITDTLTYDYAYLHDSKKYYFSKLIHLEYGSTIKAQKAPRP